MIRREYSVYQFFPNDMYERVVEFVDIETAVETARRLGKSVGARLGMVERIIITDGGDCLCFEWIRGKGVTDLTSEDHDA